MSFDIPLFELNFGEEEAQAVAEAVRSRWISMGPRTAELERRFAEHIQAPYALAVNSCTAALHIATAMTVGPGDEVVVPSLTFVATVNAVRYTGATPVFADITSLGDLSIDPEDVRRKITPRTKAILPMHYGGFPCDMDALTAIALEHKLTVIEDAAHAPASRVHGKYAGAIGEFGCFSFFSNKNITCAEGGMLVLQNDEDARRARLLRSHGMTTVSFERAKGHATKYDVLELGYNYRIDDIRAALALVQLDKLSGDIQRRAILRQHYLEHLAGLDEIVVPYLDYPHPSSNYIFVVVLKEGGADRRDAVRQQLAERGIQTSVHYPAVHRFNIYAEGAPELPKTDHVADALITLPLFYDMTEEQVRRVCRELQSAL